MSDNNENVIEFLKNQQTATVCFSQQRFVNRIIELAERLERVRPHHKVSNVPNSHENTSDDKIID